MHPIGSGSIFWFNSQGLCLVLVVRAEVLAENFRNFNFEVTEEVLHVLSLGYAFHPQSVPVVLVDSLKKSSCNKNKKYLLFLYKY